MRLGQTDIKTQVQESVQRAVSAEIIRIGGQIAPPAQATTIGVSPAVYLPILTSLPILILAGGLIWWLSKPKKSRSRR